jgi:hypothetical protein
MNIVIFASRNRFLNYLLQIANSDPGSSCSELLIRSDRSAVDTHMMLKDPKNLLFFYIKIYI